MKLLTKKEEILISALFTIADEDLNLLSYEGQMLWNKLCWKNTSRKKDYGKAYDSYRELLK